MAAPAPTRKTAAAAAAADRAAAAAAGRPACCSSWRWSRQPAEVVEGDGRAGRAGGLEADEDVGQRPGRRLGVVEGDALAADRELEREDQVRLSAGRGGRQLRTG